MGNTTTCCPPNQAQFTPTPDIAFGNIRIPKLTPQMENHLKKQKPLTHVLPVSPKVIFFNGEVYEGNVNPKNVPDGYGKIYRKNGCLFIGRFENGAAEGEGHYLMKDGSYYHGNMKNNMANDTEGYFWCHNYDYIGTIIKNKFDGKGKQKGQNYQFQGIYENGYKKQGQMTWKNEKGQFKYIGTFNQKGQFHGEGTLITNQGTYQGGFVNNQKHGKGKFKYRNGKKYIGEYKRGERSGIGVSFNEKGKITYEGGWKNGLPHGRGKGHLKNGQSHIRQFDQGLDKGLLFDT